MSKANTKTKILEAAEQLFAEQGFNSTSLRQITNEANVNLASVNYHFGSKKSLIQAVLARYLEIFMPILKQELDKVAANQVSTEAIIQAFVPPLFELNKLGKQSAKHFTVMIGRGYSETQGHLRKFIVNEYGEVLAQIIELFSQALPKLTKQELFWRLHFSLGSLVFVMSSSGALEEIAMSDFFEQASTKTIVQKVVPYVAAGLTNQQGFTPNQFTTDQIGGSL
ncbi:TetR/AcrR family transcriptional regulator [Catenovulum sp. SX2]|uniref:TetR/AcrR family transcriptional regulator n=1 Tax=Catenovulum sp. SX2 TaxID=3398614 RepID=UPI003F85C77C